MQVANKKQSTTQNSTKAKKPEAKKQHGLARKTGTRAGQGCTASGCLL